MIHWPHPKPVWGVAMAPSPHPLETVALKPQNNVQIISFCAFSQQNSKLKIFRISVSKLLWKKSVPVYVKPVGI